MSETSAPQHCFNCDIPETQIPLVNLSYAGKKLWICPQCMPKLIHQPEIIVDKLPRDNRNQHVSGNSD
jgi:hypothetical protein